MQLPYKITKTLYVSVQLGKYNHGEISVNDFNTEGLGSHGFECKVIKEIQIDIDLPENFDAESAMVEILTAQKTKLEADHYVAAKRIDDQIAQLMAITNKGE